MKLLSVITLVLFISGFAAGQNSARSSTASSARVEQELRSLIVTWSGAEMRNDATAIEKLLAPEFSFLGGSTRSEYLQQVVADRSIKYSATIEDIRVDLYGAMALVTTLESVKGGNDQKVAQGKLLIMTVWIKRQGHWQCVKSCNQIVDMQINKVTAP